MENKKMCEKCLSYPKGATPCLLGIEHKERKIEESVSLQKESEWGIAQTARERVKNEAFYKDEDGKNCLDLTKTREIIQDAISNRENEIAEEVRKKFQTGYQVASGRIEETDAHGYSTAIKDVLKILKH